MKNAPEAEKALTQALALEPENLQYLESLARFYATENRLGKASKLAETIINLDSNNPFARQLLKYIENN